MSDTKPKPMGPWNDWNDGTEHSMRVEKHGKMVLEIFPEGYLLLQRELATGYHPALYAKLAGIAATEHDEILLAIGTYCQVVVDGFYTLQERSQLCAVLAGRLEVLRDYSKGEGPPPNILLN